MPLPGLGSSVTPTGPHVRPSSFDSETRIALYVAPVLAVAIGVGYAVSRNRQAQPELVED